jgi:hypothetical protein
LSGSRFFIPPPLVEVMIFRGWTFQMGREGSKIFFSTAVIIEKFFERRMNL